MFRMVFATYLLLVTSALSFAAQAKDQTAPAKDFSQSTKITIDGAGTLETKRLKKGFGASFRALNGKATCSGWCGNVNLGSWTCPEGQECFYDCVHDTGSCYTPSK